MSLAVAGAAFLLAFDLARPPGLQLTSRVALQCVGVYRITLSPILRRVGVRCRFYPSCSRYAEASVEEYGTLAGLGRSLRRLARCGPWTPHPTLDPP